MKTVEKIAESVNTMQQKAQRTTTLNTAIEAARAGELKLTTESQGFACCFHEDFIGLQIPEKKLYRIVNDLDVCFSPGIIDKYEVAQSGFIYLLRWRGKVWVYRFTYINNPTDAARILVDIMRLRNHVAHGAFKTKPHEL